MIRIDLKHRLKNKSLSIKDFELDYLSCVKNENFIILIKKDGKISDTYNLFTKHSEKQLKKIYKDKRKVNLKTLFEMTYYKEPYFRSYIKGMIDTKDMKVSDILNKIILMKVDNLERLCIDKYKPKGKTKETIEKVFNYSKYINSKNKFRDLIASLNFKVCIYCNRNYTSNFISNGKKVPTFTLDHFHLKSDYPIFSLSLYNLIPSCYVCNSSIKGSKTLEHYCNPHSEKYNFHNLAEFSLIGNHSVQLSSTDPECEKYITDFKINEIYSCHMEEVKRIVDKSHIFTNNQISELSKVTGISKDVIKNQIYDVIKHEDIGYYSLGKLKFDVLKQLKID